MAQTLPKNPHELAQQMMVILLEKVGGKLSVSNAQLEAAWGKLIDVVATPDGLSFTLTDKKITGEQEKAEAKKFFASARANKGIRNAFIGL